MSARGERAGALAVDDAVAPSRDVTPPTVTPPTGAPITGAPPAGSPITGSPPAGSPITGGGHRDEADAARFLGRAQRALRERWFACSNALGWTAAAEWPNDAVDEVCGVLAAGGDRPELERALGAWAVTRARAGIGLAETLTDLSALHAAVLGALGDLVPHEGGHMPGADGSRLVRVVSLAWTDITCGELAETAVVDPLSGLPTESYLRARLGELYDAARARGVRVGAEHALVTVTLKVAGWSRIAPLSTVGEATGIVFDAGETIAVVGRSTVVVLAPRVGLPARVRVLRGLLERRLAGTPGVLAAPVARIVALPGTYEGACGTLDRLHAPPAPSAGSVPVRR